MLEPVVTCITAFPAVILELAVIIEAIVILELTVIIGVIVIIELAVIIEAIVIVELAMLPRAVEMLTGPGATHSGSTHARSASRTTFGAGLAEGRQVRLVVIVIECL